VTWRVILLEQVDEWFLSLAETDPTTSDLVTAAIEALEADGPALGRPMVDRIKGSARHNMKELRPGSTGTSEIRILFIFDPSRRAVLLVAGDKAGQWKDWYKANIPLAEDRYDDWLAGMHDKEI
jgi:hypothetical protein